MGRKRRACGRINSQRKVIGENPAWSTGEEEEDDENGGGDSTTSKNGSNRAKPEIKVEMQSQDEAEKEKCTEGTEGKKKRTSDRKRVLTQVNRNIIVSPQLKSPPRRKYALSPKEGSVEEVSLKKSPLPNPLFNISGLSPISPVPISVYDSEEIQNDDCLGLVGSPSKSGGPLKSSTPMKTNSEHDDSMFTPYLSPVPQEKGEENVETKENEPPKRKRGRPPGKKKKTVTVTISAPKMSKKPSVITGAKRGRKPKVRKPSDADPPNKNKLCETRRKMKKFTAPKPRPMPLEELGELEIVLDSDQNADPCPMLCLVNNETKPEIGVQEGQQMKVLKFTSVLDGKAPEHENVVQLEIIETDRIPSTPTRQQLNNHDIEFVGNEKDVKLMSPNAVNVQIAKEKSSNFVAGAANRSLVEKACNPAYCNSPIFCKVRLKDSDDDLGSSDPEARKEETPHRYKLRPRRKLFPQALALHRYQPDSDKEDSEDEFVLYVDDDSEEDDDDEDSVCSDDLLEEMSIENDNIENNEPRKSSYQGGRGPRADLKALSLVTSCPVSVKWLMENFEYHLGKSLPRGFVYDQYVLLCDQHGLEPVNAASFGKLIRSVFPGLKTRRLGTRGNSKYHYNGVYLKPTSPLRTLFNALRTQQGLMYDGGKRGRRVRKPMDQEMLRELLGIDEADDIPSDLPPEDYLGKKPEAFKSFSSLMINSAEITVGISEADLTTFEKISHEHISRLLHCFENFDLRGVTEELQRFWRVKCSDPNSQNRAPYKQALPRAKLFKMCTLPCVEEFIKSMDLFLYQGAIEILFPYLTKEMPVTMHQGMRNFVKEIEIVMHKVLNGYPMKMCDVKMRSLRAFVSMWHDYSRLNKQVKSTCQILRSNESLRVMRQEFEKSIDKEAAAKEEEDTIDEKPNAFSFIVKLMCEFSIQLKGQEQSIESWVEWAQSTTEKLLKESCRQYDSKEVAFRPNGVEFWKAASDQVMGTIAKWGSVSVPHFKTFLSWIDHLISHLYRLITATSEGFPQPSFYYFHHCLQPSTVPTIPRQMVVKAQIKTFGSGKKGRNPKSASGTVKRRHRKEVADKVEVPDPKKDVKNMPEQSEVGRSDAVVPLVAADVETQLITDSDLLSFLDET